MCNCASRSGARDQRSPYRNKAESGRHSREVDPGCGVTKRKERSIGEMASFSPSSGRQVPGYKVESGMGKSFPGEGGKEQACLTQLLLQLPGSGCIPASLQPSACSVGHTVREATQLPYPVRLQLLALAQATQERFLLPTQGLPGGEEDGASHIEPHPLGLGASGWRDVPGAA